MAIVAADGRWYTVAVDGIILGWFVFSLDAHRFAIGMLRDGMVDSVGLVKGCVVTA